VLSLNLSTNTEYIFPNRNLLLKSKVKMLDGIPDSNWLLGDTLLKLSTAQRLTALPAIMQYSFISLSLSYHSFQLLGCTS
jgi:hypothetical protein